MSPSTRRCACTCVCASTTVLASKSYHLAAAIHQRHSHSQSTHMCVVAFGFSSNRTFACAHPATLLRDIPFSMLYFSLYSTTKDALVGNHATSNSSTNNLGLRAFAAGAIAGALSASAHTAYPSWHATRVCMNLWWLSYRHVSLSHFADHMLHLMSEYQALLQQQ